MDEDYKDCDEIEHGKQFEMNKFEQQGKVKDESDIPKLNDNQKSDFLLTTYNNLFQICSNPEAEEEFVDLTANLVFMRKLIKDGQINEDNIRSIPEFLQALVDAAGASQNVENSSQSISTIWCIVSRIPALIEDLIKLENQACFAACLSKISIPFDKTIIPALAVLHYLLQGHPFFFDFVFQNANPHILGQIIEIMTEQYSVDPTMQVPHRNLLNFVSLLLLNYSKFIEITPENTVTNEEDEPFIFTHSHVNEIITLLSHIMSMTSDIALGYCFNSFLHLMKKNYIDISDFCEAELDVYFVTAMANKNEEICRNACFLMNHLFEKGWSGTRFPAIETMNFIKTCSNQSIEFIARETLAIAAVHANPDTKETILKNPDFPDLVLHAIARIDDDDTIGHGKYRIMKVAGQTLLGIFHKPALPEFLDYYCQDIMLSLLSLLSINDDSDILIQALETINLFIDFKGKIGLLEEIKNDFLELNGIDILEEFIEDDDDHVNQLVISIFDKFELREP